VSGWDSWNYGGSLLLWQDGKNYGESIVWNPIHDDGDALRLAVDMCITVYLSNADIHAEAPNWTGRTFSEPRGTNPLAATRRAIVRAAAEIGKTMQ